jgi:antirestriction protein ArdC
MSNTAKKMTVPQIVTQAMIDFMEKTGLAPWTLGTQSRFKHSLPCNGTTKRRYTGPTKFLTQMHSLQNGFTSPYYFTLPNIKKLGGRVIAEQLKHSCMAVGYFPEYKDADGKVTKDPKKAKSKRMICKYWRVWNLEQTEGLDLTKFLAPDFKEVEHEPIEEVEQIIKDYLTTSGVKVSKGRPSYNSRKDLVRMPDRKDFKAIYNYYVTSLHEFGHSTGHDSRLNRKGITGGYKFGSSEYAYEELVAELTAGMCMGACGFDPSEMENSAAYIKGWLKVLKDNPDWIIKASYQAEKAFGMICPNHVEAPAEAPKEEAKPKPKAKKVAKKKATKKAAKKKTAKVKAAPTSEIDDAIADLQKQMEELLKRQKKQAVANG